eukprot:TRINITY_DN15537_c0_g1_i1.p1 TRINITY_DN15537_c0_g1~~TRINITY_DN15537_c0_g1_i1.p1  ORF type:complete len:195 (+),score=16.15 TRINITY_DN15537_c0_g1_i1:27-611(+)
MGNYFWSSTPVGIGMDPHDFDETYCPTTAAVYLVKTHQYTPGESCSDGLREMREHWIVVIDLDRRSDDSNVVGLELHLLLKEKGSSITILGPLHLGTFSKQRLSFWECVGEIKNIGGHTSRHWAYILHETALKTFASLSAARGTNWSATVNCQQFARKLLCDFGIQCNEPACGDSMSAVIDCYCTLDAWMKNYK